MANIDLSRTAWRKSSYSGGNNGQCVEVALATHVVGIRDTKDRDGGTLSVAPTSWTGFIAKIKHGDLDR